MSHGREPIDSLSQTEAKQLQPIKYVRRYLLSNITVKGKFTLDQIKHPTAALIKDLRDGVIMTGETDPNVLSAKCAKYKMSTIAKPPAQHETCWFAIEAIIPESLLPLPVCLGYGHHPIKPEHINMVFPGGELYRKLTPVPVTEEEKKQHNIEWCAFEELRETGFVNPASYFQQEQRKSSIPAIYDAPKLSKSPHSFVRSEARIENNDVKTENSSKTPSP